jgi:acyl-CoA synthetase (AMP-forming)/AMP-acid ligase II
VQIVDPETLRPLDTYRVGEVWASGSHIARGYWGLEAETVATFGASLPDNGSRRYLRTGDLGFMDADGQLFITGRMKDLLIIHGLNHYPQDIELTVESACEDLVRGSTIAFSIPGPKGAPRLCVSAEIERTRLRKLDTVQAGRTICEAIAQHHDLGLHEIVFLKPNSNPKTSSGKVQRSQCRKLFLEDSLRVVARWPDWRPTAT